MSENHLHQEPPYAVPKGIRLIRGIYWFFVVGRSFVLIGKVAGFWKNREIFPEVMLFSLLIESTILVGIYKKKSWLVPLALFYSYLTLAFNFFDVMSQRSLNTKMLAENLSGLVLALFCLYQIVVFSRSETKTYYKEKSQTII